MKNKPILALLLVGTMAFSLVGCDAQLNNELPQTGKPDKAFRPSNSEVVETENTTSLDQNSELPDTNIEQGEATTGHDLEAATGLDLESTAGFYLNDYLWSKWDGVAR